MKRKKRKGSRAGVSGARSARVQIGVHVALALGIAFLALAAVAYFTPQSFAPLDALARNAVVPLQTYSWVQFFLVITAFGGGVGIIIAALGFSTVTRLEAPQIIRLAALLTAVAVACRVVKAVTERARPEAVIWLEPLSTYSFPSAHAASAGALFGFIALYLYQRTGKFTIALLPIVFAALIGISRIVLGAHHASDVVGGFLLAGTVLAAAMVFPFEKLVKKYG